MSVDKLVTAGATVNTKTTEDKTSEDKTTAKSFSHKLMIYVKALNANYVTVNLEF